MTADPKMVTAIAANTASELNDELTIVLTAIADALVLLPQDHPARRSLLEARAAVNRCAWKTSGLLNYSARRGVRCSAAPAETLIETYE